MLVDPALSGLPAFLTPKPGLNSGLMLAQVTAAALVAENSVLAHPAGTASLPTSGNQEDFNSVGATAALKAREALANTRRVVAIELLCAAQALDLRRPLEPAAGTAAARDLVRSKVPAADSDRPVAPALELAAELIRSGEVVRAAEGAAGPLA
jgi:histidine ammonia-lyase